jgi:hypothetical protein
MKMEVQINDAGSKEMQSLVANNKHGEDRTYQSLCLDDIDIHGKAWIPEEFPVC